MIGFRPELWRGIVPDDAPPGVEGFNNKIQGMEGFVMPSTQHDGLVWPSGSAYDVIFDMARAVIHDLAGQASLAEETSSWPYRHDRDLTGAEREALPIDQQERIIGRTKLDSFELENKAPDSHVLADAGGSVGRCRVIGLLLVQTTR